MEAAVGVCVTHHVRQTDVGQTPYKSVTESRQLHKQCLILFFNHLILLLDVLQVLLHGCNLNNQNKLIISTSYAPKNMVI